MMGTLALIFMAKISFICIAYLETKLPKNLFGISHE